MSSTYLTPADRAALVADLERAHVAHVEAARQLERDVREARRRGLSWSDVGAAIGTSRQTAFNRFRLVDRTMVALEDRPLDL